MINVTYRGPDFFIVGQPKSGSTALYEMLRSHPDVYMPDLKEPDYFSSDLRRRFAPRIGGAPPQTLAEYLSLFAPARPDQMIGEATTVYLRSHVAARNIAEFNPAARIVAVLREPAALLRSLHLQLIQNRVETVRDLRRALDLEDARRQGREIPPSSHRPQLLLYSEYVRYVDQLERFRAVFPPEQMLVLIYDDFARDNAKTLRQVFGFVGVDASVDVELADANSSVLLRSPNFQDIVHRVSVGRDPVSRAVKVGVKAMTGRRLRRRMLHMAYRGLVYGPPPPADVTLLAELRRRYAPEVERLSEFLDRDLISLWGADVAMAESRA